MSKLRVVWCITAGLANFAIGRPWMGGIWLASAAAEIVGSRVQTNLLQQGAQQQVRGYLQDPKARAVLMALAQRK